MQEENQYLNETQKIKLRTQLQNISSILKTEKYVFLDNPLRQKIIFSYKESNNNNLKKYFSEADNELFAQSLPNDIQYQGLSNKKIIEVLLMVIMNRQKYDDLYSIQVIKFIENFMAKGVSFFIKLPKNIIKFIFIR